MKTFDKIAKKSHIIGGIFIGLSIPYPVGFSIFSFPDYYWCLPIGILLLLVAYYYNFVKKPNTIDESR